MAMRAENTKALRWLEMYGISRASGVTVHSAFEAVENPTVQSLEELEAQMDLFAQLRTMGGGIEASQVMQMATSLALFPWVRSLVLRVFKWV